MAKLWSLAYEAIEANEPEGVEHFGWIPQEMLHATVRKDVTVDLRTQINTAFRNVILPLPTKPDDEQAWVDRFLLVASHLDDGALLCLDRLTGLKGYAKGSSPYFAFAVGCDEYNVSLSRRIGKLTNRAASWRRTASTPSHVSGTSSRPFPVSSRLQTS